MNQRFFTVIAKGLKGKERTPYVKLQSEQDDKIELVLLSRDELANWDIDEEVPVVIGSAKSNQSKLT
ncbi:hypothetical protein KEJ15_09725 [Candidatus Bathyarchaeota archaeon]|nr:hypothetical protein [Candidatus Bathyarchaeota archaeon]